MNPHFATLVLGLAHQAESALRGELPPGVTAGAAPDPREVARTLIDTLGMLEAKTQGRLDDDERALLSGVLTQLRIAFATGSAAH